MWTASWKLVAALALAGSAASAGVSVDFNSTESIRFVEIVQYTGVTSCSQVTSSTPTFSIPFAPDGGCLPQSGISIKADCADNTLQYFYSSNCTGAALFNYTLGCDPYGAQTTPVTAMSCNVYAKAGLVKLDIMEGVCGDASASLLITLYLPLRKCLAPPDQSGAATFGVYLDAGLSASGDVVLKASQYASTSCTGAPKGYYQASLQDINAQNQQQQASACATSTAGAGRRLQTQTQTYSAKFELLVPVATFKSANALTPVSGARGAAVSAGLAAAVALVAAAGTML